MRSIKNIPDSGEDNNPQEIPSYGGRIADMQESDKPREKCLRYGVKSLSDAELIAIALGSGLQGKSVLDLSKEILHECENRTARLATMTIETLCNRFKGVGPAKAISLLAAIELGMRVGSSAGFDDCPTITSAEFVNRLMSPKLRFLNHEEFWILCLDRRNRVRHYYKVSAGGLAATVVDLKLIFRFALEHSASSIIAVHNHPSGSLTPSHEDDALTRRIMEGAKTLDIRFLDHVIISETGYFSYTDSNRL